MKLTQQTVSQLSLPNGVSESQVFDDKLPGFGLRLRAGGSRKWFVQYRVGGKQRRMTLGSASAMSADVARKHASEVLARVRLGEDPQANRLQAQAKASETLGTIVDRFLKRQETRLKPRSFQEQQRLLRKDWKPLHGMQADAIDRAMLGNRLRVLAEQHGASSADHARTALSALFSWAMREGFVDANPVVATNRPAEPRARDRVLTEGEIRDIWHACGDDDYGRIVRLLLLTGQRRDEIAGLRWSEVDLNAAQIALPAERTKNGRAHLVPLSTMALDLLPPPVERRELVFGRGAGSFSGFSRAKAMLDARILKARRKLDPRAMPLPAWRLHDLRRSAATGMAELGVAPHVVEAVLNHVSGHKAGVAGIYNRAAYAGEKRAALNLWAEHVKALVSGNVPKVVPLRESA